MLSLFNTAAKILQSFWNDNIFDISTLMSKTAIEKLIKAIDRGVKEDFDKVLKSVNKEVRTKLKKEYYKI